MTQGERIRLFREKKGMTLDDLGKAVGTTRQAIYKYENNIVTNIPYDKLVSIAKALSVKPWEIVGWENPSYDPESGILTIPFITQKLSAGIGEEEEEQEPIRNVSSNNVTPMNNMYSNSLVNEPVMYHNTNNEAMGEQARQIEQTEKIDLSYLLTQGKKIVTFVGTSKNGTSFIVNNLAELLSTSGVNVAILDTTKNRNSYYIYTKNEEALRETASHSLQGLVKGIAEGIQVHQNLTVYTSLPDETEEIIHTDKILETLLKNHSLILIDTDFDTPARYFEQSQEIYLVQTLDVLTIQPLTAFLRQLKSKNILDEKKLRIVLNKSVKIRGVTDKTIIGGMAYYNDPSMSFMTELFDRNLIKYVSIPFEEETYIKYLENVIECNITLKGYTKVFVQTLRELANMVYSQATGTYRPPTAKGYKAKSTFSPDMTQTLNQMKNNY